MERLLSLSSKMTILEIGLDVANVNHQEMGEFYIIFFNGSFPEKKHVHRKHTKCSVQESFAIKMKEVKKQKSHLNMDYRFLEVSSE